MMRFPVSRWLLVFLCTVLTAGSTRAAAAAASEAEQLRIINTMAEKLRARIGKLPVLLPADHPLGEVAQATFTLNQDPVVVEGERFDGLVVSAPAAKASFGWAFTYPPHVSSWYILREQGDMQGFANFLRRPRAQIAAASDMKPVEATNVTFQKLDSASWVAGERYIIWFRFKDATPAEVSVRAGFFARPSLNNNQLPSLLFPPPKM